MHGLSLDAVDAIEKIVSRRFDVIGMHFLGLVPKIKGTKKITFATSRNSLTSLFLQALGTRDPNKEEEDTLKVLLRIANMYVDALKERTQARIVQNVNAYIFDQNNKGKPIDTDETTKIFRKEMDKAGKHFNMIANTESNKTTNVGTALQIAKIGETNNEEDPTVFFVVTKDDVTGFYEYILHTLPDKMTPRLWKLSEISHEYYKNGNQYPSMSGLHPNCFVGNEGVNILTEESGYKNIKDIKIGDRVLTHTGKFKKVLNNLNWYNKKYYGKFVKIKYNTMKRDGLETITLRVTPDHKFLTNRGWVEAKDLKTTDKFQHLMTKCGTCNSKTYVRPKRNFKDGLEGYFCSKSCKAKYQWSLKSHRNNVSKKNSDFMKDKWKNPTQEMLDKVKKMNLATQKLIDEGEFWAQKPENLEILQKNIAKINQVLQKNKTSMEEKEVFDKVKSIFPTAIPQHLLEKWCVDIYIPELGVNIEYDGGGHYLPVYTKKYTMESFLAKQEGRDNYLQKCGHHVIRYSSIPSEDQIKEDVMRVSKNHNSEYFFEDYDILSVETVKNGKCGYRLYDLTVEDDESFVVNGVVSHNCRCKLTYMSKGFTFNQEGKATWKTTGWDELAYQRKTYGLPKVPKKPGKRTKKSS
jgi:intein/homing endonuclease